MNFKQNETSVFMQFRLGDKVHFLGNCLDLDSIPNPKGGIEYRYCKTGKRTGPRFKKYAKAYSPPDNGEVTLTELLASTVSFLEQAKCPATIYALWGCGETGVQKNWKRGAILYEIEATDDPINNAAHRSEQGDVEHEYTMTFPPPRYDVVRLTPSRLVTDSTQIANAVAVCLATRCDDCDGAYSEPCTRAYVGYDGAGGATPDVEETDDFGQNWTNTATDPFAIGEDIMAMACFEISTGTNRILAVRAAVVADPLECAFSDNRGATWSYANIGATNNEGIYGPRSLFVLDSSHLWVCTDSGAVYFSDDGGETWTEQTTAEIASLAANLNAIHGSDEFNLVAVGDSDTVIKTADGGISWVAMPATGSGDTLTTIYVFDAYRALLGTLGNVSNTPILITYDGANTWDNRTPAALATSQIADMDFKSPGVGMIIANSTASTPEGSVWQTIDGGKLWENIPLPTTAVLNSIRMCDLNEAYAVGELETTAVLLHFVGAKAL